MSTESAIKTAMTLPLVPAAFFGVVLGLGGLATTWRAAAALGSILASPSRTFDMKGDPTIIVNQLYYLAFIRIFKERWK